MILTISISQHKTIQHHSKKFFYKFINLLVYNLNRILINILKNTILHKKIMEIIFIHYTNKKKIETKKSNLFKNIHVIICNTNIFHQEKFNMINSKVYLIDNFFRIIMRLLLNSLNYRQTSSISTINKRPMECSSFK